MVVFPAKHSVILYFTFALVLVTATQFKPKQEDVNTLLAAGKVLVEAKKYDEALQKFEEVLSVMPTSTDAYAGIGMVYIEQGKFKETVEAIDKAIELQPTEPLYHTNRGVALLRMKKFSEALESHEKALEIDPKYWNALWNKAETLFSANEYAKALSAYEIACDTEKDEKCYRQLAFVNYLNKKYKEGLEIINEGISKFPTKGELFFIKCKIELDGLVDLSSALNACSKALELDPTAPNYHFMKGTVLLKQTQYREALQFFDKAIELYPYYLFALENRGIVKLRLKDYEGALPDFTKVIESGKAAYNIYSYRCSVNEHLENFEDAVSDCETALKLMPKADPSRDLITSKITRLKSTIAQFNEDL